jgi:hypothetical protein
MTPEQQGVFFDLFKRQPIADWLAQSSAELRIALHNRLVASQKSRGATVVAMAGLKTPQQFCTPLLTQALADRLGETLDIRGVVFQHIRSTSSLFGLRKKLVLPTDRDLLVAACENFEVSETRADNYDDNSLIYQPERINGRGNKILAIQPHSFAQLCRELDLGKQYQTHLNTTFEPYTDTGTVRLACTEHSLRCFDVDRHLALMKQHISADVFRMLGDVIAKKTSIKLGEHSIAFKRLELLGHTLHGAMLIVSQSDGSYADNPCVLYLPGDPEQPLKAYENLRSVETDLCTRHQSKNFAEFLLRFVSLGDRGQFHSVLAARMAEKTTAWFSATLPTYFPLTPIDVDTDLFVELYRQRVAQVMADARLLVVPTDDEDEKTRLDRLDSYATIGLNIVMFGASFIPVVGEVMMAVAAAELLLGVYHGVESWSAGEQEQATDYFFDTLENLLVMAAISAGAEAAKAVFKQVRTSGFVESLRQVRLPGDKTLLWKPDLAPYRRNISFPDWLKADERGLRWYQDKAYVTLGKDVYAVSPEAGTGLWEIEGAPQIESYSPRLETNDAGAWRHDSELPDQWDRLTLFRRLGYSQEDISDARALQILSVSAVESRALSRVLIDRTPPPALLIDTVQRFAADQSVVHFITQLAQVRTAALADADLQLRLLTTLKTWPARTVIDVIDSTGQALNRYEPKDTETVAKTLKLSHDKVRAGTFYAELLAGLSTAERERLLDSTSNVAAEQASALVGKLAVEADLKRLPLFDWIYQRGVAVNEARAVPLRNLFADLPVSVLDELIRYADTSELNQLDDGNVPLRLAEEARRYQQVVRVSRAYEGLYLDSAGLIDTDRLVFNTLTHLPGWKGDIYIQMLEWSFSTQEMATLGSETATQRLFMNAHADRYDIRDTDSYMLLNRDGRTRAHYFEVLWAGLSASRREALGVQAADHGVALRQKITDLALERREFAQAALGIPALRPGYVSPMRLADPLLGTASGGIGSQSPTPSTRPAALIRRAQELYPTHSLAQIDLFLTSLGTDDVLALRKLESLRLEFLNIRQVLQNWINRETWSQVADGPRLKVSVVAKTRAAQEIIRCWRRETPSKLTLDGRLYELAFAPLHLGEMPMISGDFSHVGILIMDRVGASSGLNSFLRSFSKLRELSLVGNHLTRMPQAVGTLSQLEILNLSENQIQLTTASVIELAGLTRLRQLSLNTNPTLTRAPDVSHMLLLERLELRGTGVSSWPKGATGLPRLKGLDLRDNRISEIPQDVYSAPGDLNLGTDISGNPLSARTLATVADYQRVNEISLGLIVTGYGDEVRSALMGTAMSSTWLTGAGAVDSVFKRTLWSAVSVYPDSLPFFTLLTRLRYSADFRVVYRSLAQRVWEVVEAAAEDSALRQTLFRMANVGQISADGSSLVFSDLHVRVLCYRAMNAAIVEGGAGHESQLAQLLRGLFRLQEVERLAVNNVIARTRTGPVTLEQAMEISLAFRVGLAERLNLPAQPRDMNYRLGIEVIPQTLDWVFGEVVKVEHSPKLLNWMTNQEFWVHFLEGAHQAAFDDVVIRAAMAFERLDGQLNYTREQFGQSMQAIVTNYMNARTALIQRLTSEALQRNPGLALPTAAVETKRSSPGLPTPQPGATSGA